MLRVIQSIAPLTHRESACIRSGPIPVKVLIAGTIQMARHRPCRRKAGMAKLACPLIQRRASRLIHRAFNRGATDFAVALSGVGVVQWTAEPLPPSTGRYRLETRIEVANVQIAAHTRRGHHRVQARRLSQSQADVPAKGFKWALWANLPKAAGVMLLRIVVPGASTPGSGN